MKLLGFTSSLPALCRLPTGNDWRREWSLSVVGAVQNNATLSGVLKIPRQ